MSEPNYIFLGYDFDAVNYVISGLIRTLMHADLYKKHEGEEE